jgi:hypothetical protein
MQALDIPWRRQKCMKMASFAIDLVDGQVPSLPLFFPYISKSSQTDGLGAMPSHCYSIWNSNNQYIFFFLILHIGIEDG